MGLGVGRYVWLLLWLPVAAARTTGDPIGGYLTEKEYLRERQLLLSKESEMGLGHDIVLSPEERVVNSFLMNEKRSEYQASVGRDMPFPPSLHFTEALPLIERSKVFNIIKMMPKGAVLHTHDQAMVSRHWLLYNVTYRPNCYYCINGQGWARFIFADTVPSSQADCGWILLSSARATSENVTQFDQWLYNNLTLFGGNLNTHEFNQNTIWRVFQDMFAVVKGLVYSVPIVKEHFYKALQEFHDDNVQYVECRTSAEVIAYEPNGTTHTSQWVLQQYKEAMEQFRQDNPDSSGAKVILASGRNKDKSYIQHAINDAIHLRNQFPGFVLGFDLVTQEDIGHTNLFYLEDLLHGRQESLPYYFHSGETDWEGTAIDDNLLDAVLLNSTRIGHGFALTKHPELMRLVKQRGIAIEVNPISNQVLGLVRDLRNHPMSFLMAQDFPVVISSDDNAMWESRPLSHDFYMAFMGMVGEDADLRFLKKLAWNSLKYSAMEPDEKASAIALWEKKWNQFIQAVMRQYSAQTNIVG